MKFLNLRTVFILTFLTKNKYLRMIWILNLFIFKVKELFSSKKIQVKIIQNYLIYLAPLKLKNDTTPKYTTPLPRFKEQGIIQLHLTIDKTKKFIFL